MGPLRFAIKIFPSEKTTLIAATCHTGRTALRVFTVFFLIGAVASPHAFAESTVEPKSVPESYLRAVYERDTGSAYALLSESHKTEKTLQDYGSENRRYSEAALLLTREHVRAIQFGHVNIEQGGDYATAVFSVTLPDANDPFLTDIVEGFDAQRLGLPDEATLHLAQTLDTGEEVEMALVFRIDFEVSEDVKEFSVEYQFYPMDDFPEGELT